MNEAKEENARLRASLQQVETPSAQDISAVSSIQFEKEAIEKQLSKVVSEKQLLEEERRKLVQAMTSSGHFHPIDSTNIDIAAAVYGLCDKLSAIQKPSDTQSHEIDALRMDLANLEKEYNALKEKIAYHTGSLHSATADDEISFLKEENLRLMSKLKKANRQRDEHRAELRSLRSETSHIPFNATCAASKPSLPPIPEPKYTFNESPREEFFNDENTPNRSSTRSTQYKQRVTLNDDTSSDLKANAVTLPTHSPPKQSVSETFNVSSEAGGDAPGECNQS